MTATAVHHLNCGTLCPAGRRWVNGSGGLFARGRLVCHCLLVETARAGLVLVDTGLGTREVADPRRLPRLFNAVVGPRYERAETAIAQVRALGFAPEDVRHIVVTHLDLDHAGGLADFPWAEVHLHQAELDAALARASRADRLRYQAVQWAHGPRWQGYAPGGDEWHGLRAIRALRGVGPELALVPLVGHSQGHSGVAVDTGSGWQLHAGDAYFHRDELAAPARCPIGLRLFQWLDEVDRTARHENQERLRVLAARSDVIVFSAHDPDELERLAALAGPGRRATV